MIPEWYNEMTIYLVEDSSRTAAALQVEETIGRSNRKPKCKLRAVRVAITALRLGADFESVEALVREALHL